jgi:hypothetical protein
MFIDHKKGFVFPPPPLNFWGHLLRTRCKVWRLEV